MTGPLEQLRGAEPDQTIGGAGWRRQTLARQEQALPAGRVALSCSAPAGSGGLGRHVEEIVAAFERRGQQPQCVCGPDPAAARPPRALRWSRRGMEAALMLPPLRLAAGHRALRHARQFDSYAASRLPDAEHLIAFNGTALAQLQAAARSGYSSTAVVSATSHFRLLVHRHARAHSQYPIEESWASRLLARNLAEYALAQRIYVASDYAWESFVAEGFQERALTRLPLTPHPRYQPDPAARSSSTFDIVYVGSLSVAKGVPLLIDAVRALPHSDIRLRLVGGWKSRGMRRFVQAACARDARIAAGHGDPLLALRAARLCVHPSYNDGFAYAPAEALACGVPAVVSADTGMKELIVEGRNGLIVPTGELRALAEAIDAAYHGELRAG